MCSPSDQVDQIEDLEVLEAVDDRPQGDIDSLLEPIFHPVDLGALYLPLSSPSHMIA